MAVLCEYGNELGIVYNVGNLISLSTVSSSKRALARGVTNLHTS